MRTYGTSAKDAEKPNPLFSGRKEKMKKPEDYPVGPQHPLNPSVFPALHFEEHYSFRGSLAKADKGLQHHRPVALGACAGPILMGSGGMGCGPIWAAAYTAMVA